eukprot:TRINITY_DN1538_c0_g1_i1.p1 TRINITY_DN1538_c0_g1~~TRINITY_DN1538_c0_g1_i1.p1  ORF type:complete len:788 (+),score=104.68 TRINITY_DN1538_c0_g1_i1:124-2364(+)
MLRSARAAGDSHTGGSATGPGSPGRQSRLQRPGGGPLASPKSSPRLRSTVGGRTPLTRDGAPQRRPGTASEPLDEIAKPAATSQEVTVANLVHTIQQLATLEATLWNILEGIKSRATYVSFFCREYWGTSASRAQLSLDRLTWNERLKKQVSQACVLESLSLAVVSHLCTRTMQDVSVQVRSRLTNLLYYIHENCLVVTDLLRQRLHFRSQQGSSAETEAAAQISNLLNFEILVRVNRYRQYRKGEHVLALKQHNEMITNVLRQLCRGSASSTKQPTVSRGRGDQSPGAPRSSRLAKSPTAGQAIGVIRSVNDVLSASAPLDRLRPRTIFQSMLQFTNFQPLLNVDVTDQDCPWPEKDPYNRFGTERFATDGPIIWFEPLPPMMADLDRNPSLPPPPSDSTYTLVLDLDETLVHYFECDGLGNYGVRPGMNEFLARMHAVGYELVIFTAATQDYADWVIGQIDPEGLIHHRLYRQNALPWGPLFAKDLSRLGRDLDRTLIIDNVQENFMLHPNNGIFISTWYDDPQDTALTDLTAMLQEIVTTKATVPDVLDKYREQIPVWAGFGRGAWENSDPFLEADQRFDGADDFAQHAPLDEEVSTYSPPHQQPVDHQPHSGVAQAPARPYGQALETHQPDHGAAQSYHRQPQQPQQLAPQPQAQPPAPRPAVPSGACQSQPATYHGAALPQQRPAYTALGIAGPCQAPAPGQKQEWQSVAPSGIAGPYQHQPQHQPLPRTGLSYNPFSRQQ